MKREAAFAVIILGVLTACGEDDSPASSSEVQAEDGIDPVELTGSAGERIVIDIRSEEEDDSDPYAPDDILRPYLTPNYDDKNDLLKITIKLELTVRADLEIEIFIA